MINLKEYHRIVTVILSIMNRTELRLVRKQMENSHNTSMYPVQFEWNQKHGTERLECMRKTGKCENLFFRVYYVYLIKYTPNKIYLIAYMLIKKYAQ